MPLTKRLRELRVRAFEVGFHAAIRGAGMENPAATVMDAMTRTHSRDLPSLVPECERGFDTGLRYIIAMGGREEFRSAMADAERLRLAAHRRHQASLSAEDAIHIPIEPCASCEWIAGCARTGWACETFRTYVARNGTRGSRPCSVPDREYDFAEHGLTHCRPAYSG